MKEIIYPYIDVSNSFRIKRIHTAFAMRRARDYYFDGEQHDFWEVVVVADGEIGVTAGSDVFVLEKGQAIIHEPMEFHRLWSEGSTSPYIMVFSFAADSFPRYSSKILALEDVNAAKYVLSALLDSCGAEQISDATEEALASVNFQLALKELEAFLLGIIAGKPINKSAVKTKGAQSYAKIVSVMEENTDKNLSVSDIAKMCNMSEINLQKTFSRYSGMGVKKYFNNLKVTLAKEMIRGGSSVAEASERLGFENQNYFSTVFKRLTGKAPSCYKCDL